MSDDLLAAKDYLRGKYRDLFSTPDWDFADPQSALGQHPMWSWQTNDLRSVSSALYSDGALLLDPEIGICLYILRYRDGDSVRGQMSRALSVRSRLLPAHRSASVSGDHLGAWRVVLYWLVNKRDLPNWISKVADLREGTGHFEEVAVDAVINEDQLWSDACSAHGFPRLLFEVRSAFRKESLAEVTKWQSANVAVRLALSDLPNTFSDSLTKECARRLLDLEQPEEFFPTGQDEAPCKDLFHLSIQDFRNLSEIEVDFRSSNQTVSSSVIHGPNGSGKSSIFEALCIGVAGTSGRHQRYLEDVNRNMWGHQDRYATDYLLNFGATGGSVPTIGLNNGPRVPIQLVEPSEAPETFASVSGTFFSQEASKSLVSMTANDLGAEIASTFSSLAERATEILQSNISESEERQKSFNDKWGLRANITRRETVLERVLKRTLERQIPPVDNIIAWLRVAVPEGSRFAGEWQKLSSSLAEWRAHAATLSRDGRDQSEEQLEEAIKEFLIDGSRLFDRAAALLDEVRALKASWPDDLSLRLDRFAAWLGAAPSLEGEVDRPEVVATRIREAELAEQLASSLRDGQLAGQHAMHLETAAAFVSDWSKVHDDTCPTCASEVAGRGGISRIVSAITNQVQEELSQLRFQYQSLRADMDSLTSELAELGVLAPAISSSEREEMRVWLGWLVGAEDKVQEIISDVDQLSRLKKLVAHLSSVPTVSRWQNDTSEIAEEIVMEVSSVLAEYEDVSRLPVAWKNVRREFLAALTRVTSNHLPKTLQSLWLEIARNMMPAPWQYPGDIGFRVEPGRTSRAAAVVISSANRNSLAAHILNGAEVHNLGVAWFLTRYLTFGRFRHRFMVVDDPAHSMDQPTFRDFCRFLESLLRLHRAREVPLSLVLLLHQDSRAVDAARATGGVLHLLRWNKDTLALNRRVRLHDESMVAPQPVGLSIVG